MQKKFDKIDLTLSVESGMITDREFEEKVMETFWQIGVDVEETQQGRK